LGEVLTQSEIDNLLAALSGENLDVNQTSSGLEKGIKPYDFERPVKFSKEHLRTLEIIYEHYGRLISTNLPVYLRKNVQVSVADSEAVIYSEFSNALTNPVILGIVNFAPLNGNIIVELSTNLGFAMIDRMLGGQGNPLEKNREFSEIEMIILEKIMVICIQLMHEPWKNVAEINPVLERIETNAQFAQIIAPGDMIAFITLNIKMGDTEGYMNICLPFFTLEDVIDNLNTKFWYSTLQKQDHSDYENQIESLIKRVDVPVRAVLGSSQVSVSDFLNLQVGDIIRLNSKVDTEMNVFVGNMRKFTALPGSVKENYAVRVTSVIREGD